MTTYRDALRMVRGRKITVDGTALIEFVKASGDLHSFMCQPDSATDRETANRLMDRWELCHSTLAGMIE